MQSSRNIEKRDEEKIAVMVPRTSVQTIGQGSLSFCRRRCQLKSYRETTAACSIETEHSLILPISRLKRFA